MFHLFQAFGVELEYMIVDARTLDVRPIADLLLERASKLPGAEPEFDEGASVAGEVALGAVSWSNELCLHVLEMKTAEPARSLAGLAAQFQSHVCRANALLEESGARLLPGAMHPWMDPLREMKLWPHGYGEVYATFDRIFGCTGHGWANLQSAHLNLPYQGDDEFGRLHGAIRAILPIMPAIAASSPLVEGRLTGLLDNRLEVYRHNSRKVPSVAGRVIPEPVYTHADYEREILGQIAADLKPLDPEGVLEPEWTNSRGCIARFIRNTIEVRVLDVQECPAADLAVVGLVESAIRAAADGTLGDLSAVKALRVEQLERILIATIRDGDEAILSDESYFRAIGASNPSTPRRAADVWREIADRVFFTSAQDRAVEDCARTILSTGCLARRISKAVGSDTRRDRLRDVFTRLADCLARGESFRP